VIGAILPNVISSPFVYYLHFLRVDAIITVLAVILVGSWGTSFGSNSPATLPAMLVIALLVGWWPLVMLTAFVTLAWERKLLAGFWLAVPMIGGVGAAWLFYAHGRFDVLILVVAAVAFAIAAIPKRAYGMALVSLCLVSTVCIGKQVQYRLEDGWFSYSRGDWLAWQDVQKWAASHSRDSDIFLVPLDERLGGFEVGSRRRVWIELQQGGAAMWQPSFYDIWRKRVSEVQALRSTSAEIAYARSHGIAYVVTKNGADGDPVYKNSEFSVFSTLSRQ
jgi:hypothetical protein